MVPQHELGVLAAADFKALGQLRQHGRLELGVANDVGVVDVDGQNPSAFAVGVPPNPNARIGTGLLEVEITLEVRHEFVEPGTA